MRIVQQTQVVRLGRIGSADLTSLHSQLCLAEAASFDKNVVCGIAAFGQSVRALPVAAMGGAQHGREERNVRDGARSGRINSLRSVGSFRVAPGASACDTALTERVDLGMSSLQVSQDIAVSFSRSCAVLRRAAQTGRLHVARRYKKASAQGAKRESQALLLTVAS